MTQDHHTDANKYEREESSYVCQAHHLINSGERCDTANRDAGQTEDDTIRIINTYYSPEDYTINSGASTLAAV